MAVGDRQACLNTSSSLLKDLARYSLDLEQHGAHSPFEISLAAKLQEKGADATIGEKVGGDRTGLLVRKGGRSLVVECNGHPFEDASPVPDKDARLKEAGTRVLRFSPRHLRRDLDECANQVMTSLLGGP